VSFFVALLLRMTRGMRRDDVGIAPYGRETRDALSWIAIIL
jgi:hypothetical protein